MRGASSSRRRSLTENDSKNLAAGYFDKIFSYTIELLTRIWYRAVMLLINHDRVIEYTWYAKYSILLLVLSMNDDDVDDLIRLYLIIKMQRGPLIELN